MADIYVDNSTFQTAPVGMSFTTTGCTINAGDNTRIDAAAGTPFVAAGVGNPLYVINTGVTWVTGVYIIQTVEGAGSGVTLDRAVGTAGYTGLSASHTPCSGAAESPSGPTGPYPTIQMAIDNSSAGDTIWLKNNTQYGYSGYKFDNLDQPVHSATEHIMIDSGGSTTANTWLTICGHSGSKTPVLVTLDANGADVKLILIDDVDNIKLQYLKIYNAGATSGEGINITNGSDHQAYVIEDCEFDTSGKYGIRGGTNSWCIVIRDCVFSNQNAASYVIFVGYESMTSIINNVFESGDGGTTFIRDVSRHMHVEGNIFGKCSRGIFVYSDAKHITVCNNVFYDVQASCIELNAATSGFNAFNNIFVVADGAADYVIKRTAGSINYSDYNCAYAISGSITNGWGFEGSNSFEADPQFVLPASDDFRLLPGSPCLNTGKPTPGNGFTNTGYSSIGAWQRKSFLGIN